MDTKTAEHFGEAYAAQTHMIGLMLALLVGRKRLTEGDARGIVKDSARFVSAENPVRPAIDELLRQFP